MPLAASHKLLERCILLRIYTTLAYYYCVVIHKELLFCNLQINIQKHLVTNVDHHHNTHGIHQKSPASAKGIRKTYKVCL